MQNLCYHDEPSLWDSTDRVCIELSAAVLSKSESPVATTELVTREGFERGFILMGVAGTEVNNSILSLIGGSMEDSVGDVTATEAAA